jgi:hypothetical protein
MVNKQAHVCFLGLERKAINSRQRKADHVIYKSQAKVRAPAAVTFVAAKRFV